ncbi:MAG: MerR family transcriptional regulator [Actinomycetota bacterium]|nr:MerR family transcriptional regulator [Acidimicrobiaceae bacterium]MCH2620223.1 MerR family transcriptional regulator [Acidimicrobiales bacterium]MEC7899197.1 MerR family transcriptional regulator [Actinomycetota bacterium]|tara:strand:- start:366 stop:842 length:477 start_codon:yes stop_codon:yes gene_type:complete
MSKEQGYSGDEARKIVGITYRQLDYWARTELIRPSLSDASGSGTRRRYSYRDLLKLKAVKALIDAGIRLALIRRVFEFLEEKLDEDVVQVNLVIQGSSVMVQRGEEEIIDLLHNGQGVLNILPMAGVKEDLDAKIVELFPGADETSVGIEDDGQAIAQ